MLIAEEIRRLGLKDKPVCIHSSMGSFDRKIDDLLGSFLEQGVTVMVPAFSDVYEAPPVPHLMPEQNGTGDHSYFFEKEYTYIGPYCVDSRELSVEDMGIFSASVVQNPLRLRGNNALNSFAAIGPLAQELVQDQTNEDVYAPLRKLYELDGYVLLIGTDLTAATAIHYAEQLAGRAPFVRWAQGEKGMTIAVRAGGCSEGFEKLAPMLKPFEKKVTVCGSQWRCYRVRDLVDNCKAAFLADPLVTHCGDPECCRCNDAAKGGPLL